MAAEIATAHVNMEAPAEETMPEEGLPEVGAEKSTTEEMAIVPFEANQETALVPCKKRRAKNADGLDADRPISKPRWGDKAFTDITIADVETIVRKCNSLEKQVEKQVEAHEKQVEAHTEVTQQLNDVKQQAKEMQKQIEEVGPKEVLQAKSAMTKQFLAQMQYVYAWNTELKNGGRELSAFIPNVSPELLVALGGDLNVSKMKQTKIYFDRFPSKCVPPSTRKDEKPGGTGMVLAPTIMLKYIKTSRELQVKGSYRFGECERKKGRGKAKKTDDGDAGNEAEQEDEEENEASEDAGVEDDALTSREGGA